MMRAATAVLKNIFYSLPVQLLINHLKRNQVMLLCWVVLFAMVTGRLGKQLGVQYLFLDPEYLGKVNFTSFFIVGSVIGGFTVAFHTTSYIADSLRCTFLGAGPRPFRIFALNNSLLPFLFLCIYLFEVNSFQIYDQFKSATAVTWNVAGLLTGYFLITILFFLYLTFTNKDILKYVAHRIEEKVKRRAPTSRASELQKLDKVKKQQLPVKVFLDGRMKARQVDKVDPFERDMVMQVFHQNHFNLVLLQIIVLVSVVILGLFKDYPMFQIPAAASFTIFLSIFVMLSGAFTYWFGNWSGTVAIILFLIVNYLVGEAFFSRRYESYGLDYRKAPVAYTVKSIKSINDSTAQQADKARALDKLNRWKDKFTHKKKMIFLCASGGGKRAALWTLTALQRADSVTGGRLTEQSALITGASGGLVGAGFFRELAYRKLIGEKVNPYAEKHRASVASDNLNPLLFSLLANDVFTGYSYFNYGDHQYRKDMAYTFEEQLNEMSEFMMDKAISDYALPESEALIPTLIMSPTIINDGRKIYIGAQPVSFMNNDALNFLGYENSKIGGTDFIRLFEQHGAGGLRFLSALRMSATFPYITPATTLPTEPPILIMDAGISDNFGIIDAIRYIYAFKDWINTETDGVIIISIRDSEKLNPIPSHTGSTILNKLTQPISSVYNNFENFQDINADLMLGQALEWLDVSIDRIDFQYTVPENTPNAAGEEVEESARASLSWRLTNKEKGSIVDAISSPENKRKLQKLVDLLRANQK